MTDFLYSKTIRFAEKKNRLLYNVDSRMRDINAKFVYLFV